MKKRILNIILSALILSLCSCGGKAPQMTYTPGVGENIESVITSGRELGSSSTLTGSIHVACVFVSDSVSEWSEEERGRAGENLTDALAEIERAAAEQGAEVRFDIGIHTARIKAAVPAEPNYYGWMAEALRGAGLGAIEGLELRLAEEHSSDGSAILFMLAREGRAYHSVASDSALEYGVCYGAEENSIPHILYGMFGAYELSYPEALRARAQEVLGNSVMNGSDSVDPLTAYLVGWTDADARVREFFDGLSVTQAEIDEAREYDTYTGFASREREDGIYVGYLVYGVADGKGRMTYSDGRVYDGEWKNDLPHGEGSMTYPDGSVITGSWVKGEIK